MATTTTQSVKTKATKAAHNPTPNQRVAVILIRSMINKRTEVRDTLKMLRLHRQNACTVHTKTQSILGMLRKVKDCTTFGEIDDETYKTLCEKRGQQDPNNKGALKPYFRLSPPRGGFERKGTKKPYSVGGALGYRGNNINDLIRSML
ncbi:uL30 family ribosomal protein [Candidatus Woesearchaeota archaeon]|nr:uL30 family ribosomal protein [Candidatus Woesearchaeota archaeon]